MDEETNVEELRENLHALKGLVQSEGWKLLQKIAESQVEMREKLILASDMIGVEEYGNVQRLQYERKGIKLMMQLPETLMESMEEEIKDGNRERS